MNHAGPCEPHPPMLSNCGSGEIVMKSNSKIKLEQYWDVLLPELLTIILNTIVHI